MTSEDGVKADYSSDDPYDGTTSEDGEVTVRSPAAGVTLSAVSAAACATALVCGAALF
jgi:hypothetical protein